MLSSCRASSRITDSRCAGATSCTESGTPSGPIPDGTEAAGNPATFQGALKGKALIWSKAVETNPRPVQPPAGIDDRATAGITATSKSPNQVDALVAQRWITCPEAGPS